MPHFKHRLPKPLTLFRIPARFTFLATLVVMFTPLQLPSVHHNPSCDGVMLRLPDVLERQELSLNLLSKLVLSLILEKYLVVLEYFPTSLKIIE